MAVRIKSITFDCADPHRLAQFWLQLTGFSEDPAHGNAPGDPEGNEFCIARSDAERAPLAGQLGRAFDAVAGLIANIRPGQGQARPGRFGPAQIVAEQAPAIERLAAFLGRPVSTGR